MKQPKHIPDYSSPAEEQRRERSDEEARRQALELYNESTFGERRPITSKLLRIATFLAIGGLLIVFLPRRAARLALSLLGVAYVVWEARTGGWTNNGWESLRHPRRWW